MILGLFQIHFLFLVTAQLRNSVKRCGRSVGILAVLWVFKKVFTDLREFKRVLDGSRVVVNCSYFQDKLKLLSRPVFKVNSTA
jgi:hypothetical protein